MEDLGSWWVLHIKPNCEKMVATYLLNRNISYYLPLFQKQKRVGFFKRIRTREVPLFSGYLCFALERQRHDLLYDTKKLVRIIKVDDQEGFVRELQAVAKAVETGNDLVVRPGIVPGRRVLILSGPLEGTEGIVVRHRNQKQISLSVQMFNQSVLVNLDQCTELEPLS
jgi:transcription antitermination factor NusG